MSRIQNYSLDVIEYLYRANDTFVKSGDGVTADTRRSYQQQAMTQLRLLAYMSQLSMEHKVILPKQYEQIAERVHEVMNLLGAWIRSDEKRFGKRD